MARDRHRRWGAEAEIEKRQAGGTNGANKERRSGRGGRQLTRWDIISQVAEERRPRFTRASRRTRTN